MKRLTALTKKVEKSRINEKRLTKHVTVLVSPTCGLKMGKAYVRKITGSKSLLTNCVQQESLGGVPQLGGVP